MAKITYCERKDGVAIGQWPLEIEIVDPESAFPKQVTGDFIGFILSFNPGLPRDKIVFNQDFLNDAAEKYLTTILNISTENIMPETVKCIFSLSELDDYILRFANP